MFEPAQPSRMQGGPPETGGSAYRPVIIPLPARKGRGEEATGSSPQAPVRKIGRRDGAAPCAPGRAIAPAAISLRTSACGLQPSARPAPGSMPTFLGLGRMPGDTASNGFPPLATRYCKSCTRSYTYVPADRGQSKNSSRGCRTRSFLARRLFQSRRCSPAPSPRPRRICVVFDNLLKGNP